MGYPPHPNHIGKARSLTTIDGARLSFLIEDEIVLPQGDGSKLIYFQKFRWTHDNSVEYRLTYYMIGVKPRRRGKCVFGQYSLMLPALELSSLLKEARTRGWEGV